MSGTRHIVFLLLFLLLLFFFSIFFFFFLAHLIWMWNIIVLYQVEGQQTSPWWHTEILGQDISFLFQQKSQKMKKEIQMLFIKMNTNDKIDRNNISLLLLFSIFILSFVRPSDVSHVGDYNTFPLYLNTHQSSSCLSESFDNFVIPSSWRSSSWSFLI